MMNHRILTILIFILSITSVTSGAIKHISDFGLKPDDGSNAVPYISDALEFCRNNPGTHLVFAPGRYDFYPEGGVGINNSKMNQPGEIGLNIDSIKDMILDGCGAEFIFHGKMSVATISRSQNIELKDFTVDWDRPILSQGEIIACEDNYLDLKVDKQNYPYVIERDTVFFTGEGWKKPVLDLYSTLYDKDSKEVAYTTWDASFGNLFTQKATEISPGVIRFHAKPKRKVSPGTMVLLYHVRYFSHGITITDSKDIVLKDILLYHTLGHGAVGIHSENITMDNFSCRVNDAKGRYFSIVADASHFVECKGQINVFRCSHTGQGDDFINVHSTSIRVVDIIDPLTLTVPFYNKGNGTNMKIGDEFWFIKSADAQRGEARRVIAKELVEDGENTHYRITFDSPIPEGISGGDFLENKSWIANLHIKDCKILKKHRARGILVTTPGKVVIENNYFRTAGASILLEGDFNYWYESGANNDVTIRNNIFDNCLTSGARDDNRGQWGYAIINISPSYIPADTEAEPYHHNIIITDNVFRFFDAPIVNAASVRNFKFCNNNIVRTVNYLPYTWQKSVMKFDGCRDVLIDSNQIDPDFLTRDIETEHMLPSQISVQNEFLTSFK